MRKILIALFIALFGSHYTTLAQDVVSSVSHKVGDDQKIIIEYFLSIPKVGIEYEISLVGTTDGWKTSLKPKSISGDFGIISQSGRKKIVWDVLTDVEQFEGDNCAFKIIAEQIHSTSEVASDIFFGDEEVINISNGFMIGGGYMKSTFPNAPLLSGGSGVVLVGRFTIIPLLIDLEWLNANFDFNPSLVQGYSQLVLSAINISASISILPLFHTIIPAAGIGCQFSALHIGDLYSSSGTSTTLSQKALNSFYGVCSIQINFNQNWKLIGSYKLGFSSDNYNWNQLTISLGYNYDLSKKSN